jgi:tetratricopeptide (TPR) repeat protein
VSAASHDTRRGVPGPIFGRHEILDQIERILQRARQGGGEALVLIGGDGVGKTTVLRATVRTAQELGFQVMNGRALPVEIPQPFSLVQDLLRPDGRADAGPISATPSPLLPMFLGPFDREGSGESPPSTGLDAESLETEEARWLITRLASPVESLDASRSTLFARLVDFLLHLASSRPLLLAIDDLHFADFSSREFLRYLAPHLPEGPIVIAATSATDAGAPDRGGSAVDFFSRSPNVTSIRLRPLTPPELGEYVRWMLHGRDPGVDAVMRWYSQTEGNPLFVEHLLRATMGYGASASPPSSESGRDLVELLRTRLRSLPDDQRRLLAYASALGKEFHFPVLAAASEQSEERVSEDLDRLVQIGLVREKGAEVYEFVSEVIRADVYAELTETRRRILHRKIAHALEASSGSNLFELARQSYLGRDDPKALEYNRKAAERAAQSFAYETAVVHLDRAYESAQRLPKRDLALEVRLQVELGRFLDELGRLRRSEEVLLDAVARARATESTVGELPLALLGLAQTRSDLSEFLSSKELALEAFGRLEKSGTPRERMAAHRILGIASWRLGDSADAERHQREQIAIAEEVGTPVERGHALIDLANTLLLQAEGRDAEALELYRKAAELFGLGEDHAALSRVLMNRALHEYSMGQLAAALTSIAQALESAERSRSPIWIGYCCLNLGQFQLDRHDLTSARAHIDRAASLLEPLGDRLAAQQIAMIRGMIAEEEGKYDEAQSLLAAGLSVAEQLKMSAEVAEMQFRLAHLALRRGDRPAARSALDAALAADIRKRRSDLVRDVDALERALQSGEA